MNPLYRSLIKPIRDKNLLSIINNISVDQFSPYDKELNFEERILPIKKFIKDFKIWATPISGLHKFDYVYITNGNTDALNILFSQQEGLLFDQLDYRYYSILEKILQQNHNSSQDIIFTWPSYNDGTNYFVEKYKNFEGRKHLDIAYLGLTPYMFLDTSSFETVNISFSKTLSIPFNRIGITFSKHPIPILETMNKIGYINLSGVMIAHEILKNIKINYWMDNYWDTYLKICADNNLMPTNCILFAYDNNIRVGIAELYDHYIST